MTGDARIVVGRDVYYGWVVAVACFVGAMTVFGVVYSFGVFFDALVTDVGASRSRVALVFSAQSLVMYVAAAGLGGFVDRFGARRMLATGAALMAGGLVVTSRADGVAGILLGYGVVASLGMSLVYVVSYATVPRWFGRRRGLATGIATSGLGAGQVVFPPLTGALVAGFGWRLAYVGLAGVVVALAVLAVALLRDDPAAHGVADSGEFPDGEAPAAERPTIREQVGVLRSVARTPSFLVLLAGWTLVYGTLYVVTVHVVAFTSDLGVGRSVGVAAIGLIGLVTGLSRLGVGFLSDYLGRVRVFVACSALMGAATVAIGVVPSRLVVLGAAVAFGLGYGGNGALLSPLTADLFGTEDLNAVYGLLSLSFATSGVLAPWLAGLTRDVLGTYVPAFLAAGAAGLVGAALVAAAGTLAPGGDGWRA